MERNTVIRKDWLDGLRAVAMLLVMLGHLLPGFNTFFLFTSPVKLPLFFAISGYLFNDSKTPNAFFSRLMRRLVVPWLVAVSALLLVQVPFRGIAALPSMVLKSIQDVTLWYIVCLIFAEIIWYAMRKVCRGTGACIVAALLLSAAGFVMARTHTFDALMINRAFIAQAYLLIGFLFRRYEPSLRRLPSPAIAAWLSGYIALGLLSAWIWPGKHIDVHLNRYYSPSFCMLMIWVGCMGLMAASCRIRRVPKPLVFIGRNTLVFYMVHSFAIRGIEKALSIVGLRLTGLPRALILMIPACIICAIAALLVNRFLPELAGRRRPTRTKPK